MPLTRTRRAWFLVVSRHPEKGSSVGKLPAAVHAQTVDCGKVLQFRKLVRQNTPAQVIARKLGTSTLPLIRPIGAKRSRAASDP
jgi:hypothetical protein